jgi:tetratricopeptide (TPR) repeat protein
MANCIICHLGIIEGLDKFEICPNGHPAHYDCLKEWLIHSTSCPLCQEDYPKSVSNKFKGYIEEKKKEKRERNQNVLMENTIKKMEIVAKQVAFLKFIEAIERLIEIEEYDYALSRLDMHDDFPISDPKGQQVLFLKGKINYLRGRFDLAINFLFKLVKEKFDFPEGFFLLGKAYEALGLTDKAKWAFDRVK